MVKAGQPLEEEASSLCAAIKELHTTNLAKHCRSDGKPRRCVQFYLLLYHDSDHDTANRAGVPRGVLDGLTGLGCIQYDRLVGMEYHNP